jgi:hypothetical protein
MKRVVVVLALSVLTAGSADSLVSLDTPVALVSGNSLRRPLTPHRLRTHFSTLRCQPKRVT